MRNIAVFASGRGSNFAAIARAVKAKKIHARLALLVCDNPHAGVIAKAKKAGVPVLLAVRSDFSSTRDYEAAIAERLKAHGVDVIVLAGFMRIISPLLISRFPNKILNIHPALLPAFKGSHAIADAFAYGVRVTGVTVHFVDQKMDHGPIILQEALAIRPKDTPAGLEGRIHRLEHVLYPKAIELVLRKQLSLRGRSVKITS